MRLVKNVISHPYIITLKRKETGEKFTEIIKAESKDSAKLSIGYQYEVIQLDELQNYQQQL